MNKKNVLSIFLGCSLLCGLGCVMTTTLAENDLVQGAAAAGVSATEINIEGQKYLQASANTFVSVDNWKTSGLGVAFEFKVKDITAVNNVEFNCGNFDEGGNYTRLTGQNSYLINGVGAPGASGSHAAADAKCGDQGKLYLIDPANGIFRYEVMFGDFSINSGADGTETLNALFFHWYGHCFEWVRNVEVIPMYRGSKIGWTPVSYDSTQNKAFLVGYGDYTEMPRFDNVGTNKLGLSFEFKPTVENDSLLVFKEQPNSWADINTGNQYYYRKNNSGKPSIGKIFVLEDGWYRYEIMCSDIPLVSGKETSTLSILNFNKWEASGYNCKPTFRNVRQMDGYSANVTFNDQGTETKAVAERGYAVKPANPTAPAGKHFVGWATVSASGELFDFSTRLTADTTLYAKYEDHDYKNPEYSWDGDQCSAVATCDCGAELKETVTGQYVMDSAAKCEVNEKGHYEATFADATFTKQSTEKDSVEVPGTALDHDYEGQEVSYVWDEDECTASVTCKRQGCGHIETETVDGVFVEDTKATCTGNQKGHYEATFENPLFTKQSTAANSVEIPESSLGHDWTGTPTYEWDEDECTATIVCKRDGCEEEQTETVDGVFVEDTPASCLGNQKGHYEATFENELFVKQSTEANSVEIPNSSLGHDWTGVPTYEWDEDECTATIVCKRDGCEEKQTEKVKGTYMVESLPSCGVNGTGYYHVEFENELFEAQDSEVFEVPGTALDHDYEGQQVTYTWDGRNCKASVTCKREGCGHKLEETVAGVYVKDTAATCTTNEKGHFKATFTNEEFVAQQTAKNSYEVLGTALGHSYEGEEAVYTWSEDNKSCTASIECHRNGCDYILTETVQTVVMNGKYWAVFQNAQFEAQTKDVPPAPAKSGCGGSVIATSVILSTLAIAGAAVVIGKKRKEDK